MAEIAGVDKWPTLLDVTQSMDPGGGIAAVAEILNETNEILEDMVWIEANGATNHRTSIRTGLPEPTWRAYYQGVQPTKSSRAQISESLAMLEDYAEVDKALADLNGNTQAFRLSEDYAHIEGMSQKVAYGLIYGSEAVQIESFTGFAPRYNSLSAGNADNIIDAGGTGDDNASIWLVVWGPNTVHGLYPKGSKGGLQVRDLGEVTIENVDGLQGRMQGYRTHYKWDLGLCVRDWRYVVRIANIDRSLIRADMTTGADVAALMFDAIERIPSLRTGRPVFYMDRSLRTMLGKQQAKAVTQSTLTVSQHGGIMQIAFHDIPIRRVDKMSIDEARVV